MRGAADSGMSGPGWYPSWDAQNLWSAVLAEKFGYRLEGEYRAYEVVQGPEKIEQMFFFH